MPRSIDKLPFSSVQNLNVKDGIIIFNQTYSASPFDSTEIGLWVKTTGNVLMISVLGTDKEFVRTSQSLSPSVSPSVSKSPSVSPSLSPSASPSLSPSVSVSPSVSLSPSASPSVSPSVSVSPSL